MKTAHTFSKDGEKGGDELPEPSPVDSIGAGSIHQMKELADFLKSVPFDDHTEAILEEKVDSFLPLYPNCPRDELKEILRNAIHESNKESKGGRERYWCKECNVPLKNHLCVFRKSSKLNTKTAPKQNNKNKRRLFDEAGNPLNRCGFCGQRKKLPDGSDHKIVCRYCKYCGHPKSECIRSDMCPKAKTWIDCREKWDG